MRRSALLVPAAILALALLWWRSSAAPEVEHPAATASSETTPDGIVQPAEHMPPVVLHAASDATVTSRMEASPPLALGGTIVVLDELGREFRSESGFIVLHARGAPGTPIEASKLTVTHGEWDPNATPGVDSVISSIVLGGREALLEGEGTFNLKAHQPAALRARWIAQTLLHVVDAGTGAELDGVRILRIPMLWGDAVAAAVEAGETTLIGSGFQSPIKVDPQRFNPTNELLVLQVYRHDYAWGALPLDRTSGGAMTVKLAPGADLTVLVVDGSVGGGVVVRLWKKTDHGLDFVVERNKLSPEPFLGLAEGEYEAHLERGSLGERATQVLASAPATIVGGVDEFVELKLPPPPAERAPVDASVVVKLDETWDLPSFTVLVIDLERPRDDQGRIRAVRREEMSEREPRVFVSKPLRLRPGRYHLDLLEARYGVEREVTSVREQELLLEVPASAKVTVTVVDAQTSQPIEDATVLWFCAGYQGENGEPARAVEGRPGVREFRAPLGPVRLWCESNDKTVYAPDDRILEVLPGSQELTIALRHPRKVTLSMREGDRPVDCPMSAMDLEVSNASGKVHPVMTQFNGKQVTCLLRDPGVYTLKLPPLPGREPIPDIRVDLTTEESTEVVVQLVRRQ